MVARLCSWPFLNQIPECSTVDPLPTRLPLEFVQHRLGVNQVVVEDRTRHRQQFGDERVAEGLSHGRLWLASRYGSHPICVPPATYYHNILILSYYVKGDPAIQSRQAGRRKS